VLEIELQPVTPNFWTRNMTPYLANISLPVTTGNTYYLEGFEAKFTVLDMQPLGHTVVNISHHAIVVGLITVKQLTPSTVVIIRNEPPAVIIISSDEIKVEAEATYGIDGVTRLLWILWCSLINTSRAMTITCLTMKSLAKAMCSW